jgi:hypothetical protein
MGYFSDIIQESKKPINEPQHGTMDMVFAEERSCHDVLPGDTYPSGSGKNISGAAYTLKNSTSNIWKEGDRHLESAPKGAQQAEPDTRQVVDPLPREYTGKAGPQEANRIVRTNPNPGEREQTGLKSRRTVISAGTERKSHFNDSISTGTGSIDLEDEFVLEPLSNRRVECLHEESAETQGSGKAGETDRAGSTTPSIHLKISTRSNDQITPIKNQPDVSTRDSTHEILKKTDFFSTKEEFLSGSVSPAKDKTAPQQKSAIISDPMFMDKVAPPSFMEKAEGMPMVTTRKTKKGDKIEVPWAPLPREGRSAEDSASSFSPQNKRHSRDESPTFQVQIGLLEVVVVSPENGLKNSSGEDRRLSNLASRNYLRNI